MSEHLTVISQERFEQDELEFQFYGINSTQMYLQYREVVDKEIKLAMLKIAEMFDKNAKHSKDIITKVLGEKYLEFYAKANPILQNLYQEIQTIFKLPENVALNLKTKSAEEVFHVLKENPIQEEIAQLQEEYIREKYYLEILKQKEMAINNINLSLKELMKTFKKNEKCLNAIRKINEAMDKTLKKYDGDISRDDIRKIL